jgi:hypothetical protein
MPSLYSGADADRATAALVAAVCIEDPGDARAILETLDLDDMQGVALTLIAWFIKARGSYESAWVFAQQVIRDSTAREAAG